MSAILGLQDCPNCGCPEPFATQQNWSSHYRSPWQIECPDCGLTSREGATPEIAAGHWDSNRLLRYMIDRRWSIREDEEVQP